MGVLPLETSEELQRLHARIIDLEYCLAEADTFRNYLVALGELNEDEYACAYKGDCKSCSIIREGVERDWATCLGYNVKLAAEKAEVSLRGEAEG